MTREYGRFELQPGDINDTHQMYIEDIHRSGDFWLTLSNPQTKAGPIGYLRFREIAPHIFELAEVRPGRGPLLNLESGKSDAVGPQTEGSESRD